MQLFSVEQQRSQALEAHAAAFASFKVSCFYSLVSMAGAWRFEILLLSDCFMLCMYLSYRLQEMRILLFLFHLPQRPAMLGKLPQSYMSLSLVLSQVLLLFFGTELYFIIFLLFSLLLFWEAIVPTVHCASGIYTFKQIRSFYFLAIQVLDNII